MLKVVKVSGSGFNRGLELGRKLKQEIIKGYGYYHGICKSFLGEERILKHFEEVAELIKEFDEELYDEIRGLAAGSGLSLTQLALLNSRYEVMSRVKLTQCTSFSVLPSASQSKCTLIGQNWDLPREVEERQVILIVKRIGEPSYVTNTEAGVLAHKGMNEFGLGFCFNALKSSIDSFKPSIPTLVILRKLYDCRSFSEAIRVISKASKCVSSCFLIGHRDGEAICIEATPKSIRVVEADGKIILHTNHFIHEDLKREVKDLYSRNPGTHLRLMRIRNLFFRKINAEGKVSIHDLMNFMRDHFNYPESICSHTKTKTISSTIINLNSNEMYFALGNPCKGSYELLDLSSEFKSR